TVVSRGERALITTLTKKMSEDLSDYLLECGLKVRYLHSNIQTIERIEILRDLRLGEFDVLVGINLLREGLDLPEVSLVAILDADKEGFLRSSTSLIQTMGRAARNSAGRVVLYADVITDSMRQAITITERRRERQIAYNTEHGIEPETIRKAITDLVAQFRSAAGVQDGTAPLPSGHAGGSDRARRTGKRAAAHAGAPIPENPGELPSEELTRLIDTLEAEMRLASAELRFEYAARLRDEVRALRRELREVG
ncbi:MAG TPA: helicase-related protein, partial [Acidimicrobiales bacterium]|nr:helicase-related protein [Acidimicrobiales bacterium]